MSEDYIRWLVVDQAKGLLNLHGTKIAKIMGICRQTLVKHIEENTLTRVPVESVNNLENHIQFVKSALLITEATPPTKDSKETK